MTVGDTGVQVLISAFNFSNSPDSTVTLTEISAWPSCGIQAASCTTPDPGVFAASATGVGVDGSGCAGKTFAIGAPDATGKISFTPANQVVLPVNGRCEISYTLSVQKMPAIDSFPGVAGIQTNDYALVRGTSTATGAIGTSTTTGARTVFPTGELRVTTSPALPSQIMLDGVPRNSFGLNWVNLPAGSYTVSYSHVPGYTEPVPQAVTVTAGRSPPCRAPSPSGGRSGS